MKITTPFPEVLDSSLAANFKQCRQLFYKQYIMNWKPKGQSVHLHAGGAFAKGIEVARNAFYCGEAEVGETYLDEAGDKRKRWLKTPCEPSNADIAEAYGLQALLFAYGDFECPADSAKSAARMAGAFEFYFTNYPLSNDEYTPITLPSGKRGIEFGFVQPLPILHPETGNPLLYSGRMDALLNFAGGVFITDEKTTSQLGASWSRQWDLRSQFTGYAWGCRENGVKADGVIVRGVSILKTKYETQHAISYRPEWQIERWYSETMDLIEEMIQCWKTGKWRYDLDHACAEYGGCQFRAACASQDESSWLETYFVRRHWDPITRIETDL